MNPLIRDTLAKLPSEQARLAHLERLRKAGIEESELQENPLDLFLTQDPLMLELKRDVEQLQEVQDSVLILGPTGTGKELIARSLHGFRNGKFVAINCTGLPDYLLESELFGHVKGSFTGALVDKVGLLEEAKDGTLFLDEIGDMPVEAQAKLLRVIETRSIRRVGDNLERPISCRFIAATNKSLCNIREDILYRLGTFTLSLTPLTERLGDIMLILNSLLPQIVGREQKLDSMYRVITATKGLDANVRRIQQVVRNWQVLGKIQ